VHIGFTSVDAKAAAVPDSGARRDFDHLPMQLDDLRTDRARAIFQMLSASGASPASMRVNADAAVV
jgi:hypothetical protein